jgi:hypothetical protein
MEDSINVVLIPGMFIMIMMMTIMTTMMMIDIVTDIISVGQIVVKNTTDVIVHMIFGIAIGIGMIMIGIIIGIQKHIEMFVRSEEKLIYSGML